MSRRRELDGVRAIAALSVLGFHAVGFWARGAAEGATIRPWVGRMDVGVAIFFLLSGFLLYRPMLASRVIGLPKQKRSAYARNRFFRIMPAYWVVLTVAAIVPGFYGAFTDNWWVYYTLLQSFPIYTPEGVFVEGRATRGLDRFAVRRDGNSIVVNLDSLFEQDKDVDKWSKAFVTP